MVDKVYKPKYEYKPKPKTDEATKKLPVIVNIKQYNLKQRQYRDLEHWLEWDNHVYIGRKNDHVKGANQSKWANPFPLSKYTREECLELYKQHILDNKDLYNDLGSLEGKIMGCWCKPEGCHGDVLIELFCEKFGIQKPNKKPPPQQKGLNQFFK